MLLEAAGPLQGPLQEPKITEVMVNPDGRLWVVRFGQGLTDTGVVVPRAITDRFLRLVATGVGAELHGASPTLHAALQDHGWRIQGAVPPVVEAPSLTIRKHPQDIVPLDTYEAQGILTRTQRQVLEQAIRTGQTLVIAGSVASSKTTLANALLDTLRALPLRVLILEDDRELHCAAPCTLCMRTVDGRVTMRDLVKDSLRHYPDRLIIGEVRDGAAHEWLKSCQTGHYGLTTVHADSAYDALLRLEQLVLEVSIDRQRELIARVVKVVAHMERWEGSWRCKEVLRVKGLQAGEYVVETVAVHPTVKGG
jgi:type IV secretion system protein TrbB